VNEDPYLQETNRDQVLTSRTNQSNKVRTDHSIVRSNSSNGLYKSLLSEYPNETEISNRNMTNDVLLYIKKANEKIKKNITAAEKIDEELQKIVENYFPSKFNKGNILELANKYYKGIHICIYVYIYTYIHIHNMYIHIYKYS
jgi:hypothetical protein